MKFPAAMACLCVLALPALGACTPLGMATGAAASVGVAASQEGGLSRAASDLRIQAEINDLWFKSNVNSFLKLDLTVNQGRVLVTGVVQDPEERVEAIRLAWQPEGVKQVINEIQVANSRGISGFARDSWITTRLRTALTFDRNVQSINYSIDTVKGVVYLIGTAQSQAELNRVIEIARTIPDVRRVVSYVKLAGKGVSESVTGQTPEYMQYQGQTNYQPMPLDSSETGSFNDGWNSNDSWDNRGWDDGGYSPSGAPQSLIESEPL
jgi:osmotically-inducible protein OsmY